MKIGDKELQYTIIYFCLCLKCSAIITLKFNNGLYVEVVVEIQKCGNEEWDLEILIDHTEWLFEQNGEGVRSRSRSILDDPDMCPSSLGTSLSIK